MPSSAQRTNAADKTAKRIEIAAQKTPARRHSNECRWQPDSRLIVASACHPAARRPTNIAHFDRQVQTAGEPQVNAFSLNYRDFAAQNPSPFTRTSFST